jgi:hypothetical protein
MTKKITKNHGFGDCETKHFHKEKKKKKKKKKKEKKKKKKRNQIFNFCFQIKECLFDNKLKML